MVFSKENLGRHRPRPPRHRAGHMAGPLEPPRARPPAVRAGREVATQPPGPQRGAAYRRRIPGDVRGAAAGSYRNRNRRISIDHTRGTCTTPPQVCGDERSQGHADQRHPVHGISAPLWWHWHWQDVDRSTQAPDVVGIFTRADDDQLSEIVCKLPRRSFEDTKSSDDWLAWTVRYTQQAPLPHSWRTRPCRGPSTVRWSI